MMLQTLTLHPNRIQILSFPNFNELSVDMSKSITLSWIMLPLFAQIELNFLWYFWVFNFCYNLIKLPHFKFHSIFQSIGRFKETNNMLKHLDQISPFLFFNRFYNLYIITFNYDVV